MTATTHPRPHPQAQLLTGMDGAPLVLHHGTGTYHRLSPAGAALFRLLDGEHSRDEVTAAIAAARSRDETVVRAELDAFLDTLARAGLLDGSAPPPRATGRARRSLLLPRFVLTRRLPRLLDAPATALRAGHRTSIAFGLLSVLGVIGAAAGLVAFAAVDLRGHPGGSALAYGIAAVALLLQVALHEGVHALVCQVLRAPVRAAGVALLFWLVPVAYVDRTDAYRIRGRAGRVALALAGPLTDGIVAGATALVAVTSHGLLAAVAARLLVFQTFTLLLNVNPLLPSDGYVAIEAATGLVDPRGRAFTLVRCLLRRRPLPAHLAAMTPGSRRLHLAYGGLCVAYIGVIVLATITGLIATVGHVVTILGG